IQKIDDRQNIAHWKKMYSAINQAFNKSISEGYIPCDKNERNLSCIDQVVWTRQTKMNDEFIYRMLSNFNVTNVCNTTGNTNCNRFPNWAVSYGNTPKTLKGGSVGSYNFHYIEGRLATGELIMFGDSHGGPWISVDVNGFRKGPDKIGKDIFIMKVYDDFIRPLGAEGTFNKETNGEICGCGEEYGIEADPFLAQGAGAGEVVSGGCCSAYYLLEK
ncbi:MAG: hypothetical protein ACLSWI_00290, partial [Candidatus Gastranaerophilaceae bacterium]